MVFKKRREEKEIRDRRQAIKEQMEHEEYDQSRKETERKRREAEAERKRQEEEIARKEKEQLAAMPVNELLVKIYYELQELRQDVKELDRMMNDNTSELGNMKKSISSIEDKVESMWLNTL